MVKMKASKVKLKLEIVLNHPGNINLLCVKIKDQNAGLFMFVIRTLAETFPFLCKNTYALDDILLF